MPYICYISPPVYGAYARELSPNQRPNRAFNSLYVRCLLKRPDYAGDAVRTLVPLSLTPGGGGGRPDLGC